jgi:predicted membrane-bound spermidine synthase
VRKRFLMLAVFVAGMSTLAIELSASRLLGTVYGTSNIVWANIIGLILVYLSAGYFLGGRWADRWPNQTAFYRLIAWAGFTSGLIPLVAQPVLLRAAQAVERLETGLMVGSFLSVLLLFSLPITLLGCVSPYAIRLALEANLCLVNTGFDPGDVSPGARVDSHDRYTQHIHNIQHVINGCRVDRASD